MLRLKKTIHILAVAIMLAIPSMTMAQGSCGNFHRSACSVSENRMFNYNGQSRSALFAKGKTSELNIVVYKGQDYRISFCSDVEKIGDQIQFKIFEVRKGVPVEKQVEEKWMEDEYVKCSECSGTGVVDEETCYNCNGDAQVATGEQVEMKQMVTKTVYERRKEVLYDNSQDGMAQEIEFSIDKTKKLIIEVSIPAGETPKHKLGSADMACLGVLIEHMTTPRGGF